MNILPGTFRMFEVNRSMLPEQMINYLFLFLCTSRHVLFED